MKSEKEKKCRQPARNKRKGENEKESTEKSLKKKSKLQLDRMVSKGGGINKYFMSTRSTCPPTESQEQKGGGMEDTQPQPVKQHPSHGTDDGCVSDLWS